ncbi:MAG: YidC/Oxa1 family membrane protein insertase, partial [Clostridia bacterium]|nr:YidC/Oxa1 family membrane protein insertase [Clostridia bacterium]
MTGFYEMLAVPFGYVIGFFYDITHNYLLSILFITLITRLILLPSSMKQQKSSAAQMRMQSKVRRIQEMYKGNQQKINEETQALYQREGFNPMSSGCLPMLIQLPVMIGLYSAIRTPLTNVLHLGTSVVTALTDAVGTVTEISNNARVTLEIEVLNHLDKLMENGVQGVSAADFEQIVTFRDRFQLFGITLSETPGKQPSILWLLPIISGITALGSSVFMFLRQKKQNPTQGNNAAMLGCTFLMGPAMSIYFGFMFPGGISLYWILGN